MQNYRVEVQNHSEAMEAQELFFNLGYSWFHKKFEAIEIKTPETIMCFENGALTTGIRGSAKHKQITLPELRDLAVLKRNDRKDANVLEDNCLYDLYLTKSRELYFYHCGKNKWILSNLNGDDFYYELLKPIEKPMKEYLNKLTDGTYKLVVLSDVIDGHDGLIEVPDGAEILTACGLALYFWNKTNNTTWVDGEGWVSCDDERLCTLESYLSDKDTKIVWQRESLNDQVASAEKARQEQIQCKCSTKELHESDLVNDGQKVVDSLVVGLAKQNSQESKVLIPSIHGKVRSNPDLYGLKSTGFSEGGFIPKQNHGAPVGLLHHGFSGFTQPEELPFVDDEPKLRNIKIRVNGNLDKAIETIQSMGYWNCQFNRIPSDCYWLVGNSDATVDYGSERHMHVDHVEYFVDEVVNDTQATLNERQSQYGEFSKVAEMTQGLLFVMNQYSYESMPDMHKEALHMICSKMARIVNGDHNHLDSWHDIGGYAKLIENNIK